MDDGESCHYFIDCLRDDGRQLTTLATSLDHALRAADYLIGMEGGTGRAVISVVEVDREDARARHLVENGRPTLIKRKDGRTSWEILKGQLETFGKVGA